MTTISYTEARDKLASVWDETLATREPVVVKRRGHESVVILALEEWQGVIETAHLLRSPANARRLLGAIERLENGQGSVLTTDQVSAHVKG